MAGKKRMAQEYHEAVMHAFNEAADGVELWEYAGADTMDEQVRFRMAAADVAKRIRRMSDRYHMRHCATPQNADGGE